MWAIHLVMKLAVQRNIHHVHVETANIIPFDMLAEKDEEDLEIEGLTVAVQQINILHAELNRVFRDGTQPRSCRITSVFTTRNRAPMFLAKYGFRHCSGLVEVPYPFGNLVKIVDLDNGMGPHFPAFEIMPNFGLGEVVDVAVNQEVLSEDVNLFEPFPNNLLGFGVDAIKWGHDEVGMAIDVQMMDFVPNQLLLQEPLQPPPTFTNPIVVNRGIVIKEPAPNSLIQDSNLAPSNDRGK
ncbi:hypothetical protein POM88_036803 [Heracleum sosnowskyi]|uniref:Uncharacterized protein n=1 Tax=Heracleum sosnowskyi TaxID=360622 RepID=A0AAD8MER1_9APIA|nr:hypothetical protein POM88_036803 [Heracleum sosnowskyi]